MDPEQGRALLGDRCIGAEAWRWLGPRLGLEAPPTEPAIPFSREELLAAGAEALLFLGVARTATGTPLTLNGLRAQFGWDPEVAEPCFYNQDWYLKEAFAAQTVPEARWHLVQTRIDARTRGVEPPAGADPSLPTAVLAALLFFVQESLHPGRYLWVNDYIWCRDVDHNGDRIYLGRYRDPSGCNKNGLEIHRHLRLRENHGAIQVR